MAREKIEILLAHNGICGFLNKLKLKAHLS